MAIFYDGICAEAAIVNMIKDITDSFDTEIPKYAQWKFDM